MDSDAALTLTEIIEELQNEKDPRTFLMEVLKVNIDSVASDFLNNI